jgi:purine-binding chemotaxis protein CheW
MTSATNTGAKPDMKQREVKAEILRKRAAELSRVMAEPAPSDGIISIIEFKLGDDVFGLETDYLREVYRFTHVTSLPGTPAFLSGVISVRGRLLPVIDIRSFLGESPENGKRKGIAIVVYADNIEIGLLADSIISTRDVPADHLLETPLTFAPAFRSHLKGITINQVPVLDIQRIITDPALNIYQEFEA